MNNQKVHQYHNSKKEEEWGKKWGEGLDCGGRGLSKGEVWGVGGPLLRTHRAGKGPGGCGGWGLGSRNRRGPGVPPTPGLSGQGTSPGSPAGFLGSSGWGKHPPLLSCSSSLGSGRAPPTCLSCSPLSLLPVPPWTHTTGSLWGSSRLLGHRSPTSGQQVP